MFFLLPGSYQVFQPGWYKPILGHPFNNKECPPNRYISSFRQNIGTGMKPVVPAFPIVFVFRSFQLSDHSIYLRFGHWMPMKSKKKTRTEQFAPCCLLSKKSPLNFAGLSGTWDMYFKRKLLIQKKKRKPNASVRDKYLTWAIFQVPSVLNVLYVYL